MTTTQNLHLPQWEASDRIHHDDFNAAFSAIDTAIAGGVKIAAGTYTGTGEWGSMSPNSLTFDFPPKLVIISYSLCNNNNHHTPLLLFRDENADICFTMPLGASSSTYNVQSRWNGNTVSWFCPNEVGTQCNYNGHVYTYLAIG